MSEVVLLTWFFTGILVAWLFLECETAIFQAQLFERGCYNKTDKVELIQILVCCIIPGPIMWILVCILFVFAFIALLWLIVYEDWKIYAYERNLVTIAPKFDPAFEV